MFLRWNIFSRLLKARVPPTTGAFGKSGDVYFMANGEVWHGRLPNVHGRRTMICLIGLYGVDAAAAQKKSSVPQEVLAKLPPRLAKAVAGPFVLNDPSNTMLERLYRTRRPASVFSLFFWAKVERRLCEWISDRWTRQPGSVMSPLRTSKRLARGVLRGCKRLFAPLFPAR